MVSMVSGFEFASLPGDGGTEGCSFVSKKIYLQRLAFGRKRLKARPMLVAQAGPDEPRW
jgi:hypothetical protein